MVSDFAWAAGFIDGEGCISIYRTKGDYYYIQLIVACTVREPLEKLESIFGGQQVVMNKPQRGRRKASYQWKVMGRAAGEVIEILLPYLTVKRDAANVAIEAVSYLGLGRSISPNRIGLAECERRLHVLNKRGV